MCVVVCERERETTNGEDGKLPFAAKMRIIGDAAQYGWNEHAAAASTGSHASSAVASSKAAAASASAAREVLRVSSNVPSTSTVASASPLMPSMSASENISMSGVPPNLMTCTKTKPENRPQSKIRGNYMLGAVARLACSPAHQPSWREARFLNKPQLQSSNLLALAKLHKDPLLEETIES